MYTGSYVLCAACRQRIFGKAGVAVYDCVARVIKLDQNRPATSASKGKEGTIGEGREGVTGAARCVAVTVRRALCYSEKRAKGASKARATATPSTGADARPASAGVVYINAKSTTPRCERLKDDLAGLS